LPLWKVRSGIEKEEAIAMFLGVLQLASRVVIFAGLEKPSERRSKVADAATKYSQAVSSDNKVSLACCDEL
jgi:hypothetical protein